MDHFLYLGSRQSSNGHCRSNIAMVHWARIIIIIIIKSLVCLYKKAIHASQCHSRTKLETWRVMSFEKTSVFRSLQTKLDLGYVSFKYCSYKSFSICGGLSTPPISHWNAYYRFSKFHGNRISECKFFHSPVINFQFHEFAAAPSGPVLFL